MSNSDTTPLNPTALTGLAAGTLVTLLAFRMAGRSNADSYGFFLRSMFCSFATGALLVGTAAADAETRSTLAASPFYMAALGSATAGCIRIFSTRQDYDANQGNTTNQAVTGYPVQHN